MAEGKPVVVIESRVIVFGAPSLHMQECWADLARCAIGADFLVVGKWWVGETPGPIVGCLATQLPKSTIILHPHSYPPCRPPALATTQLHTFTYTKPSATTTVHLLLRSISSRFFFSCQLITLVAYTLTLSHTHTQPQTLPEKGIKHSTHPQRKAS